MRYLRQPYYVGLLSAAAIHGAAHQQPLAFQVITDRPTRPIEIGRVRAEFYRRRDIKRVVVASVRTDTGSMRVSTPEATVIDLVRFSRSAVGLDQVASVVADLVQSMRPEAIAKAARAASTADLQRLGHLLDVLGHDEFASAIERALDGRRVRTIVLRTDIRRRTGKLDQRWGVTINHAVEFEH